MKDIQPINKGIVQDSNEEFQPEGTYRFMLNGMFESIDGDRGGVVNESGNEIILPVPSGITDPHLNGTCLLPNQDVVLFISGYDGVQYVQIIGLHKNNDTYLELIRTNCLEWSICSSIDCKFKVHNGCDIILYFTDHETKYKSINITAIENGTSRYKDASFLDPNIPDGSNNYGWYCEQFYLTPVSEHPNIFFNVMTANGSLRVGTYTFFIRLLDGDLNPTDWLTWSNPITVKQGVFNSSAPPDNTDGYYADPNIQNYTAKAISLIIDNLDTSFKYYEVGIMERSLNTNTVSNTYRSGQRLIPTSGTDIFLFNRNDDSRFINIDSSVLLTKNRKIDIVQAHTQIQNRLVLGNVRGIVRDWHKFQQQANNIKVEYFTYSKVDIANNGCSPKKHHVVSGELALDPAYEPVNYSSPDFLSYGMSLMRDEIYALGIIYVFRDGSESPVFHIPGRPKFGTNETTSYIIDGFDYAYYARNWIKTQSNGATDDLGLAAFTTGNLLNFDNQVLNIIEHSNTKGSWESTRLGNLNQDNTLLNVNQDDYKYLYGWSNAITCCYNVGFTSNSCITSDLERWKYYNTAIRRKVEEDTSLDMWFSLDRETDLPSGLLSNPYYSFSTGYRGIPGYYDTGINYPDVYDCDGNRIYPEGYVRHHRMPDHRIEQLFDMVGDLGLNACVGGGQILESAWYTSSNINTGVATSLSDGPTSIDGIDPRTWSMNDAESVFQLYPLGLHFHEVNVPEEYRDDVVGYYIVRSDRTNNKTIIDKGFMNVCDTSISVKEWDVPGSTAPFYEIVDDFVSLNDNRLFPNNLFLTPNSKPGMYFSATPFPSTLKQPTWGWWNIMELHLPKANYNDGALLAGDYIKLESTVFGDMFFDSSKTEHTLAAPGEYDYFEYYPLGGATNTGWNIAMSVVLNRHKYPRVQSPVHYLSDPVISPITNDNRWTFVYNIPISGLAYIDYNTIRGTNALGDGSTTIHNAEYQQKTLLAKHTQSCTAADPAFGSAVLNVCTDLLIVDSFKSVCDISYPFHYTMFKKDILHNSNFYMNPGPVSAYSLDSLIIDSSVDNVYSRYRSWSHASNVAQPFKWSVPHSPYMYYVALKSAINPYEDFDTIRYIKMHSYLIPSDSTPLAGDQNFAVTGGDTFINRFQYEKGRWAIRSEAEIGVPADNTLVKCLTTLTVGYVESEINTAFTHLKDDDLFRSFPFSPRNSYYEYLKTINSLATVGDRSSVDTLMEKQQIYYRYKLDYSSYNTEIPSFQLPSTWDYCSNCQESYHNTLIYSEISLDSQVQDYYKIFLTNSEKDIPSYTGSIQNLFVKNSDLYVHTEHNLWKLSVAPQTMQTNSDTVEVGQGAFLDRDPIRIFNNQDSFSRGGCIDKFTSAYGGGDYVWLDRNSGSVLSLGEGISSLSDTGLNRWFRNNTELNLNVQFLTLTGLEYPFKGTSCNLNVGYIATLDPHHSRYILTKKDYKLVDDVINNINLITYDGNGLLFNPAIVQGNYYYDDNGFYIGIANGDVVADRDLLLEYMDYTNPLIAENKSWTISYSFRDKLWSSWHSYLPNWLYNDSYTFYSFITHPNTTSNQSIWRHNFGPFQTYYDVKYDFIIDYIYKKDMYQDATYDSIEYTSNVWLKSTVNDKWVEIPFNTFDRFFVYNNTQLSNLKDIIVSNQIAYSEIQYNVTQATAHQWRNTWRINRLRDMGVDRLSLIEPKFTSNWLEPTYQSEYTNGGYIDQVINPAFIDLTKNVYKIERLTDKYLGVRLFYNPAEDYKITFNLNSGLKRNKI